MGKRASREQGLEGLAGTAGMGSHNFDFELFSPESSLGISEGKALGVGENRGKRERGLKRASRRS